MNLKEIRSELRKLSALAEGWSSLQAAPPVERDMALEKLRALYETFRFCPVPRPVVGRVLPERAASDAPHAVVSGHRTAAVDEEFEMVDLSEVLSLGEADDAGEEFEESYSAGTAGITGAVRHAAPAPAAEEPRYEESEEIEEDEGPEIIEFEPEPEKTVRPVPKPAPAPQSAPQPAAVPVDVAAPAAEKSVEKSPEKPAEELAEEPVGAPAPEPAAPLPAADSEPAQSRPAPGLFEEEDEDTAQHRRKQRVIRALYDETPAPRAAADTFPAFSASDEPGDPEMPGQEAAKPRSERSRTRQGSGAPEIMLLDALTEEPVGESRKAPGPSESDEEDEPEIADERPEPFGPVDFPGVSDPVGGAAPHVLGEVIKPGVQTLADTIAPASHRYGAPIADLRQAIGINDKFLMIRDLFGGDGALFDATVEALNAQQSLDDCMIYIAENFAWNPESESAALIMELLERKFA